MGIKEIVKKALIEGYAITTIDIKTIIVCIGLTAILSIYIYIIYRRLNKQALYNKNFNLALIAIAIITSAIILTIQSNIVVSLGMVGALSIVRFRTAIKDPIDLVFLFWAISVGIICGAGFALIAVIASVILTILIVVLNILPMSGRLNVLVINADNYRIENEIMDIINEHTKYNKIQARNITTTGINMSVEIKCDDDRGLIDSLMKCEGITGVSIVSREDVTV